MIGTFADTLTIDSNAANGLSQGVPLTGIATQSK
jgi:hypothetical protein